MTQRTEEVWTYSENDALPVITKTITQEKIACYAAASGDHNPLHLDPAFAATTQFGGTIAHGMLVLAYISEVMTAAFGEAWLIGGRLKVRFRGAARPGDTVIASGRVIRCDGGTTLCEVVCRNQEDVILISGEAEVTIR
jgi:3-hydroxybutyryl-CoA dehydratase